MPLVRALIILPVKTENTFKGAVAEPEAPDFPEHESVSEGGNMTFEDAVGEFRTESAASGNELAETSPKMSVGAIVEKPLRQDIFH